MPSSSYLFENDASISVKASLISSTT